MIYISQERGGQILVLKKIKKKYNIIDPAYGRKIHNGHIILVGFEAWFDLI